MPSSASWNRPRISSDAVLRKAIARGVKEGTFAYTTGSPALGPDGKYQVAAVQGRDQPPHDRRRSGPGRRVPDGPRRRPGSPLTPTATAGVDAVSDTGGGAMTAGEGPATTTPVGQPPTVGTTGGGGGKPEVRTSIHIAFPASRDDVFKSFPGDRQPGRQVRRRKDQVVIDGQCAAGYDANWLRNAVQEPLDEANIDGLQIG